MENKIITRKQSARVDKKIAKKKKWDPPVIEELEIEKNTNSGPNALNDGLFTSS